MTSNSQTQDFEASSATDQTDSSDSLTGSHSNKQSSITNPTHPPEQQLPAHTAHGKSTVASPKDTGGRDLGQGGELHETAGENSTRNLTATTSPLTVRSGSSLPNTIFPSTTIPNTTASTPIPTPNTDNRNTRASTEAKPAPKATKTLCPPLPASDPSAGVDRTFDEVLNPHPIPFPSLQPLKDYAEDAKGEFPASVYSPTITPSKIRIMGEKRNGGGGEQNIGREGGERLKVV